MHFLEIYQNYVMFFSNTILEDKTYFLCLSMFSGISGILLLPLFDTLSFLREKILTSTVNSIISSVTFLIFVFILSILKHSVLYLLTLVNVTFYLIFFFNEWKISKVNKNKLLLYRQPTIKQKVFGYECNKI